MNNTGKRRRFIINVAYWAIIAAIAYFFFRYLLNLLLPFVIALLVSWLLRPLGKLYRRKLPRHGKLVTALTVATVLIFYLLIGVIAMLLLVDLVTRAAERFGQLPALYTQTLEPGLRNLYEDARNLAARFDPAVADVVNQVLPQVISSVSGAVTNFSVGAVGKLTGLVTSVPSFLISALIAVIATIFTSVSYDRMKEFLLRNLPAKFTETAGYVVSSFRSILGQYGKSYLLVMLITFGELTAGLLIIGVKQPILAAVLIAIFDIFPIVGAGMILLPWALISLIQKKVLQAIGLALLYVVIIVVRQFLEPKVVGKQVGLPPLVTLICMFVGSSLFGVWGLFGLPIGAAILVNLNDDPNIPIKLFTNPPDEEAQPQGGKIIYRFRRRGEKAGKQKKS
ncbi:MAG: sporulation integral membrane protein YtvI [Oscillospiraceae bacterium]|nr:sporulation integral membrane protein YtvI [Oscillospiraceae bacterium]